MSSLISLLYEGWNNLINYTEWWISRDAAKKERNDPVCLVQWVESHNPIK